MKESSKHTKSLFVSGGLVLLAVGTLLASTGHKPHRHGTDILHFFVNERMTNTGVIPDASGRLELRVNQQGNANHQGIHIDARNLETNATYQLAALLNDDTNLTQVLQLNTDIKGNASVNLEDKGAGKAKGDHPGKVKKPLPAVLDPITHIREVTILDSNSVAVLTARVASADRLESLVKGDLSMTNMAAFIR